MLEQGEEGGVSLRQLFHEAESLFQQIDSSSLSSSSPELQEMVKDCCVRFSSVSSLQESLSIFSKNEVLDDVNTADLKYVHPLTPWTHLRLRASCLTPNIVNLCTSLGTY